MIARVWHGIVPEDVGYLIELEKYVTHYELLFSFELTKTFDLDN